MALGSVVIDLLLRTGSWETDTRKAERRLREMEKTAKQVGAAIGTAAVAVGSATAVMIRNAINSMDQLDKMARQIGVATEELTGLRYAAEQMAGVTEGQFDMALRRMTRRIEEAAAGGGPAADALRRMGLEARTLARMAPDEQFRKFAEAIRNTSTQGERLRNVMALMDTEGMPLVAMLQQGADAIGQFEAEAARLGLTIDSDTARAASDFNTDLATLRASVTGLGMQVAADLLPDLRRLTLQFKETATEGDRVSETAKDMADSIRAIATATKFAIDGMRVFANVARGAWSSMTPWVDGRQYWNRAGDIADGMFSRPELDLSPVFAGEGAEPAGLFRMSEAEVALERAREAAAEAAEAARREAEAQAALAAAAAAGAKERAEAERALAEAIREAEASERAMTLAMQEAEQLQLEWVNRIDDLTARVEGPAAEAVLGFRRALADANAALATGVITMEQYQQYAQGLGQQLGKVVAEVDMHTNEMTVFAEKAAQNMQSFMGDAMFDLLDGKFKDIASSFSDMIKRMMAELVASKLLDALAQIGQNNSGTWWGSMLSGLSGKRAAGGPVSPGGSYLVGERGPELLHMGNASGRITPNHMVPAMAGGAPQVNVNIHGAPSGADVQSRRNANGGIDIDVVFKAIESRMVESLDGGKLGSMGKARFGWREQV